MPKPQPTQQIEVTITFPAFSLFVFLFGHAVDVLTQALVTDPGKVAQLRADIQHRTASLQAALDATAPSPAAPK